jgi:hypothetical protein
VFTRTHEPHEPRELEELLEQLTASRQVTLRSWQNFQEFRWLLKDTTDVDLPPPARKTIDSEGTILWKEFGTRSENTGLFLRIWSESLALSGMRPSVLWASGNLDPQILNELHRAMDWAESLLQ